MFELPFFVPRNAILALQQLELSISMRYDRYSEFGSVWTPRRGSESPLCEVDF